MKLKKMRIHFAVPCYGGMLTESFFTSMLKFSATAQRLGLSFVVDTIVNESLVTRARNSLVAKFLAAPEKCTHLMFIDADIGFSPAEIIKLMLANREVVGGLYPKKSLPIEYVVNTVPNGQQDGDLYEIKNLGTGFMMIQRSVLETLTAAHPELAYQDAIGLPPELDSYKYALFDTVIDPNTKEYLSEDYRFCQLWQQQGGKIWADLTIRLDHSGHYKFNGDPTKLLTPRG